MALRLLQHLLPFGLLACAAAPPPAARVPGPPPAVPVALALPPGTVVWTSLAELPDEPEWRAAAVWWREALRQSPRWLLRDQRSDGADAVELRLCADPVARTLAALARRPDGREVALAGARITTAGLPAAIDQLAWATRRALGEDVAAGPVPVAAGTTASPRVLLATDDALLLLRDGGVQAAARALQQARSSDGGSPFVLDAVASVQLLRGDAAAAVRTAREALGYGARLLPTTEHRLARTLLLARASLEPERAAVRDEELLALGRATHRERPYDPQAELSTAIAENFLGRFAAARPRLTALREHLPDQPIVAYHLGWACLGLGDPAPAAEHFTTAALRLPKPWVALPLAIALYERGDDDGLLRWLDQLDEELAQRDAGFAHELRRLRAAHALLRGDRDRAAGHLLAGLRAAVAMPSVVEHRAGEVAAAAALLVRLGRAEELPPLLAALQQQLPGSAVADACAYASGLVQVATTRQRAAALEAQLGRGGESAWGALLQAFAHELRGELADQQVALSRAARLDDSPLTKALLARCLRASGRLTEATALTEALRRELRHVHLRRRPQHPLLAPELAFAWQTE